MYLVDGDGKPDALGVGADGRVHADHLPELVHEGAAAVARVDGGVRLDEVHLAVGQEPHLLARPLHAALGGGFGSKWVGAWWACFG